MKMKIKLIALIMVLVLAFTGCSSETPATDTKDTATQDSDKTATDGAGTAVDDGASVDAGAAVDDGASVDAGAAVDGAAADGAAVDGAGAAVDDGASADGADGAAVDGEAGDGAVDGTDTADSAPELPEIIPGEEEYEQWYADMVETSIVSTGNNARLKKVLEKARAGSEVKICAIGGSVTEGAGAVVKEEGYAYKFARAFEANYCPEGAKNMNFVNAGLSGTPSSLGIMRYDRDVVGLLGGAPDMLIIEFSVNDSGEATKGQAYSSMIHRALSDNPDCAVILLFAVFKNKWNMQTNYIPEGEIYGLPMVSIKDAIVAPYAAGNLTDELFFSDEYHPKTYGHQIMSDCLMHLIGLVDREEADEPAEVPEKGIKKVSYEHTTLVTAGAELEEGVTIDLGSFTLTDKSVQAMYFTGNKAAFGDNFMHDKDAGNAPFTIKLNCSKLLLNFKTASSKSFGMAEVLVDGEPMTAHNGYSSGGWNNCNTVCIIDAETSADHTVEIRMASGFEDKSFTILSLGYAK